MSKKEKIPHIDECNRDFGVQIVFVNGGIYKTNFGSIALGNLLGEWRGCIDNVSQQTIYPLGDSNKTFKEIINDYGDVINLCLSDVIAINYRWNKGCVGPKKESRIYDYDVELLPKRS